MDTFSTGPTQLANEAGIDRATLRKFLTGTGNISLYKLDEIYDTMKRLAAQAKARR